MSTLEEWEDRAGPDNGFLFQLHKCSQLSLCVYSPHGSVAEYVPMPRMFKKLPFCPDQAHVSLLATVSQREGGER